MQRVAPRLEGHRETETVHFGEDFVRGVAPCGAGHGHADCGGERHSPQLVDDLVQHLGRRCRQDGE